MTQPELIISNRYNLEAPPYSLGYELCTSSGNDTALVLTDAATVSRLDLIALEKEIMNRQPSVEQVGFYWYTPDGKVQACLAGLELCGNFVRDLAYLLFLRSNRSLRETCIELETKEGVLQLDAGVTELNEAWVTLPIVTTSLAQESSATIVELPGITLVVTPIEELTTSQRLQLDETALDILNREALLDGPPASGVIFSYPVTTQNLRVIEIRIWVKKRQKIFPETACGTGTAAQAWVDFLATGQTDWEVLQPSGKTIKSRIKQSSGRNEVTIFGKVERIQGRK